MHRTSTYHTYWIVTAMVAAATGLWNGGAQAEEPVFVCGHNSTTNRTHTGPTVSDMVPKEFTRNEWSQNCCVEMAEGPPCEDGNDQIVLKQSWTVTGSMNCEATFLTCHAGDCDSDFDHVTEGRGATGEENGDTVDVTGIACQTKVRTTLKYTQKITEFEEFQYYGWCKAGDVMKKEHTQMCGRTKTTKIENADGELTQGCANEPACQP